MDKQIRYELINPSDECHFSAKTHQVAVLAVLMVGNGKYAGRPHSGNKSVEVPIFFFGGAMEWYAEKFGSDLSKDMDTQGLMLDVSECLDSFGLKGERSSLNDICKYAHNLAKSIRSKFPTPATSSKGD